MKTNLNQIFLKELVKKFLEMIQKIGKEKDFLETLRHHEKIKK